MNLTIVQTRSLGQVFPANAAAPRRFVPPHCRFLFTSMDPDVMTNRLFQTLENGKTLSEAKVGFLTDANLSVAVLQSARERMLTVLPSSRFVVAKIALKSS